VICIVEIGGELHWIEKKRGERSGGELLWRDRGVKEPKRPVANEDGACW
jgi:hypothetical protein